MSRSGSQKDNRASNAYQLRDGKDEYTAARTRPFSFDEIMERRKNKELSQPIKNNIGGVEMISMNEGVQDLSARPVSLKGARETKRLSSVIERLPSGEHTNEGTLEELRFKEEHASTKGSMHVMKRNRNSESRESAAELQSNLVSELWGRDNKAETEKKVHTRDKENELWGRDNKAETEKKVHTRDKENEWRRVDPKDRWPRREIRSIGHRDETEQMIHSGGRNDERTRNYREDRGQRNELRSTSYREETQNKLNSRSKNNELPRNNTDNRGTGNGNTVSETDKRIPRRGKDDERPRNDSVDKARQSYHRDSVVKDRYADRSEGILEKGRKRRHQNTDDRNIRNKNVVTKPDHRRTRDSEVAEKKGKKELSGSGHEETRVKRKRSRSQDRGKIRDRRSLSLPPEAHRSMSSNGKKLGDSSSHSLKDRSAEQHTDAERSKFSSNGTGNHYRGHGGSTSGLGGYSPRKRKSENAAKTPSPKNRSPERKSAGWDIPPTGVRDSTSSVRHGPELSENQAVTLNVHELVSAVTAALNASKTLPGPSGFFPEKNNASVDSIQLTESTRPMRQLYIENTPASTSEKDVMEYLNNRLFSSGANRVQGKQPCISCIINKDKHQALVEFLTPEDASATLLFDGSSFSGSILKIRRPKDFVEVATSDSPEAAKSTGTVLLSNTVKDSPHKVFIGGISEAISTEMLIDIAGAFGQLKAFYFDPKQESLKRYAFLERHRALVNNALVVILWHLLGIHLQYVDQSVTLKACAGLNGMKLGGQVLTVVQALPHVLPMECFEREPTYVIPDHAKPLLEKPTQVVKLKNVFTPEDMHSLSKSEIEEVLEDIKLECARFGAVRSLNVVEHETVPLNNSEEKCGDHNDDKSAEGGENLGHGDEVLSETCGEVSETVSEELKEVELQKIPQEKRKADLDPKGIDDEENTNEVIKAEDDSVKPSEKLSVWVGDVKHPGSKESETRQMKEDIDYTKESVCTDSNLEHGTPGTRKAKDDLCFAQNGVTEESRRVFELGSVLVEYKRTEGSCIAAHSLHGRLFDERVMMVEYVPLELYQAKFPR